MFGASGNELPIPENIAAVMAYITIFPAIVFLYLEPFKRNLFVRFHAFQHLFLWVAGLAIGNCRGILGAVLQLIPFMRVLVFPLAGLIGLAWFFLWLLLVVKAYHHEIVQAADHWRLGGTTGRGLIRKPKLSSSLPQFPGA